MELSNLRNVSIKNEMVFATIDQTISSETGMLWWRKRLSRTVERPIARRCGGFWYFADTGEFTPSLVVEALARVWEAKNGRTIF
jgi:tryptophan 2,3-dioxygenase